MDFKALYQSGKKAIISTLDEDVPMDVRLEQAEFSNDSGYWEVVVSFLIENKNLSPLNIGALRSEIVYILVKINENKEVKGIYMFSHV